MSCLSGSLQLPGHRRWLMCLFVYFCISSVEGRKYFVFAFGLKLWSLQPHRVPLTTTRSSLCVWSYVMPLCLRPHRFCSPSVSLRRVQGKRKRDFYARALGWPVKAPLSPVLSSAKLTSSSWSAAYVWTATRTPKSCPACTPSVSGEFPKCCKCCTVLWFQTHDAAYNGTVIIIITDF